MSNVIEEVGRTHPIFVDLAPIVLQLTPDQSLKGVFIRGLAEARARNPGTDLAQYIEAYVTVQVC